ncbi:MAG: hypothetical protein WB816_06535 [Methylocystis sp.]
MVIADMIHSCSNPNVAQAAVCCVGGDFADRVAVAADRNGLNVGRFVAVVMREFARRVNGDTLALLRREVAGTDQPLLRALVRVVEPALEDGARFFDDETPAFAPVLVGRGAPWGSPARLH